MTDFISEEAMLGATKEVLAKLKQDEQIERLALATVGNPHEFDPLTAYCRRCGGAMYELFNEPKPCLEGKNIVAFAPAHSRKRMGQLIIPLLGPIS